MQPSPDVLERRGFDMEHCSPPNHDSNTGRKIASTKTRTRTGCLNCRRKKRKCDEHRPACRTCKRKDELCEWGLKISFRDENAQGLEEAHPSMMVMTRRKRPRRYEILDVTSEVIRDCEASSAVEDSDHHDRHLIDARCTDSEQSPRGDRELDTRARSSGSVRRSEGAYTSTPDFVDASISTLVPEQFSPASARHTEGAVASLLFLSQCEQLPPNNDSSLDAALGPMPMGMMLGDMSNVQGLTPDGSLEDSVFLPGSAYHELHSTLRNHLIQEFKSNTPTRPSSPNGGDNQDAVTLREESRTSPFSIDRPLLGGEPPLMGKDEEIVLWRNWFQEISPWLDKFDKESHFRHDIPTLAAQHDHLRHAMLALSARQLEQKETHKQTGRSFALYQQAIHQLLPQLHTRSTPVIASCVILCVLEMLSCSPKAWRRHLDGCASLMQAVGINGFVGGLDEALFWCFARMDVCGGLISSVQTLIPASLWAHGSDLDADVAAFHSRRDFDNWANYIVYLMAQVLDLLAADPTTPLVTPSRNNPIFRTRWLRLWRHLAEWHDLRPAVLHPVMTIPSSEESPFPTVLFSNPAAISGNQLYHTASMLMLQNQPPKTRISPKPRSILWHARQICAISMSNDHHGAWTNSIQPLWIAGKCMSHPAEHRAILELLKKIEKASGWKTKWRADDLQEFWGDLED